MWWASRTRRHNLRGATGWHCGSWTPAERTCRNCKIVQHGRAFLCKGIADTIWVTWSADFGAENRPFFQPIFSACASFTNLYTGQVSRKPEQLIHDRMRQLVSELVSADLVKAQEIDQAFWKRVLTRVQPEFRQKDFDPRYIDLVKLQLRACTSESPQKLLSELGILTDQWREQQIALGEDGTDGQQSGVLLNLRRLAAELRDQLCPVSPLEVPLRSESGTGPTMPESSSEDPGCGFSKEEEQYLAIAGAAGVSRAFAEIIIDCGGLSDVSAKPRPLEQSEFWECVREQIVPRLHALMAAGDGQWHNTMRPFLQLTIHCYALGVPPNTVLRQARSMLSIREELRDVADAQWHNSQHHLASHIEVTGYLHEFVRRLKQEMDDSSSLQPSPWGQRIKRDGESKPEVGPGS